MLYFKNPITLKILSLLQLLLHTHLISNKHSQLNYRGPLETRFSILSIKFFLEKRKFKISSLNRPLKFLIFLRVTEAENKKAGF